MKIFRTRPAAENEARKGQGTQEIYSCRGRDWIHVPQLRNATLDDLLPGGAATWKLEGTITPKR